jgi:hypothetical protein
MPRNSRSFSKPTSTSPVNRDHQEQAKLPRNLRAELDVDGSANKLLSWFRNTRSAHSPNVRILSHCFRSSAAQHCAEWAQSRRPVHRINRRFLCRPDCRSRPIAAFRRSIWCCGAASPDRPFVRSAAFSMIERQLCGTRTKRAFIGKLLKGKIAGKKCPLAMLRPSKSFHFLQARSFQALVKTTGSRSPSWLCPKTIIASLQFLEIRNHPTPIEMSFRWSIQPEVREPSFACYCGHPVFLETFRSCWPDMQIDGTVLIYDEIMTRIDINVVGAIFNQRTSVHIVKCH